MAQIKLEVGGGALYKNKRMMITIEIEANLT